jgi:aryl-alcohol dehydrogenase-like predicted oxidoreductase
MQGKLLDWAKDKPELSEVSPSVGLLQFIRSTPGVLAPLVGQKSDAHVTENLQVMKINPLHEDDFVKTVKNLTS